MPMASSAPTNINHAPYTYLLRNIPATVTVELVEQQFWANKKIGFLVYTAEAIMLRYLGAIEGFNATDDNDMAEIHFLKGMLVTSLQKSPHTT